MLKKSKTDALPEAGKQDAVHTGMHAGSVDLVEIVRTVAPFLFPAKKIAKAPRLIVKKPQSDKKKSSPSTKKTAKPVRKAVRTLAVRRTASPKKATISASQTVAVPLVSSERPKGKILLNPEAEKMSKTQVDAVKESLLEEDGFMANVVKSAPAGGAPVAKRSLWSFLTMPLGRSEEKTAALAAASETRESLKDDKFLNRVEQKRSDSVVGMSVDDPSASLPPDLGIRPTAPASALESFAAGTPESPKKAEKKSATEPSKGKIISAAQLKKEADDQKEASRRIAEQTKKEMEQEQPAAKTEPADKPVEAKCPAPVLNKQSNALQKIAAGLGHFGMGKERMLFTENLATMLDAGLGLVDSLQTLKLETRNKGFKKVVARIVDRVENGSPLWRAMDSEDFFSLHAIALIRIGEEAGNLAKNMQYLAAQETKDHELVQKVKMAMIYPSIVLSIMFVIVMGLGLFVLPNLIGVLTSLNVPLPLVTRIVIGFSNAFTNYGLIIVPGSLVGIAVFILLAKYTPLKIVVQWVTFRIPGIGSLLRSATIARFGVILGGLLQAGVPVVDSVQSLVEVTPILVYKHLYEKLRDHIVIGDSFAKSFAAIKGSDKLLPSSVQQLVITGEKSGALAQIMLKVADIYDKKASETAQKLPVILEPLLLLGIGSLVGTIAFAIIVPIYSIVGSVGGR